MPPNSAPRSAPIPIAGMFSPRSSIIAATTRRSSFATPGRAGFIPRPRWSRLSSATACNSARPARRRSSGRRSSARAVIPRRCPFARTACCFARSRRASALSAWRSRSAISTFTTRVSRPSLPQQRKNTFRETITYYWMLAYRAWAGADCLFQRPLCAPAGAGIPRLSGGKQINDAALEIIIPVRNPGAELDQTVASLAAQTDRRFCGAARRQFFHDRA